MKVKLFKTNSGLELDFNALEERINEFIADKKVVTVNISFAPHVSNYTPNGGGHYIAQVLYED